MKVKEVQNKKCRIILSDLEQSNNSDNLLQLRGFTKKKYDYNNKDYITYNCIIRFIYQLCYSAKVKNVKCMRIVHITAILAKKSKAFSHNT